MLATHIFFFQIAIWTSEIRKFHRWAVETLVCSRLINSTLSNLVCSLVILDSVFAHMYEEPFWTFLFSNFCFWLCLATSYTESGCSTLCASVSGNFNPTLVYLWIVYVHITHKHKYIHMIFNFRQVNFDQNYICPFCCMIIIINMETQSWHIFL